MNKFVKLSMIFLVVLVILFTIFNFIYFRRGTTSFENISDIKVVISESDVIIKGKFTKDNLAFKDYTYKLDGNKLYLTISSVFVSNKYKDKEFSIDIKENGVKLEYIYLTDNDKEKVIYKN